MRGVTDGPTDQCGDLKAFYRLFLLSRHLTFSALFRSKMSQNRGNLIHAEKSRFVKRGIALSWILSFAVGLLSTISTTRKSQ